MSAVKLGALFVNNDTVDLVTTMEDRGYDTLFCAEGQGLSAFARLNRYAPVTDEMELSTGIVNIFSRSPSAIAQEFASLDRFSEGRAMLGLGVAHPAVSEEFHGVPFDRPITRLEEYVTLIRRYLRGTGEPYEGEFFSPGRTSFWEQFEPLRSEVVIHNGSIGEQNIKKTGEVADGWLPVFFPADLIPRALEWLEEGAERAGRSPDEVQRSLASITVAGEDTDRIRHYAALQIATYLRDVPGYYDRVASDAGLGRSIEGVMNADTTVAAAEQMDDDLIDTLSAVGSGSGVADRLRQTANEHNLDRVVVFVPGFADDETRRHTIESVAKAFR